MARKVKKQNDDEVPLRWNIDGSVATKLATNLVVQSNENGVFLSFFEVLPPIVIGSVDEVKAQVVKMGGINANCVSRVVVSQTKFLEFVDVLIKAAGRLKVPPEQLEGK